MASADQGAEDDDGPGEILDADRPVEILGGEGLEMIPDPVVGPDPVGVPELVVRVGADDGVQVVVVGGAVPPQEPAFLEVLEGGVQLSSGMP